MTTINTVEDLTGIGPNTPLWLADGAFARARFLTDAVEIGVDIAAAGFLPAQTLHPRVVTEAEVDKAAEAIQRVTYGAWRWSVLSEVDKMQRRDQVRAALTALGFEVQG